MCLADQKNTLMSLLCAALQQRQAIGFDYPVVGLLVSPATSESSSCDIYLGWVDDHVSNVSCSTIWRLNNLTDVSCPGCEECLHVIGPGEVYPSSFGRVDLQDPTAMLALIHFMSFMSANMLKVQTAVVADGYRSTSNTPTTEEIPLAMEVSKWYSLVRALRYVLALQSRSVQLYLLAFKFGAQYSGT